MSSKVSTTNLTTTVSLPHQIERRIYILIKKGSQILIFDYLQTCSQARDQNMSTVMTWQYCEYGAHASGLGWWRMSQSPLLCCALWSILFPTKALFHFICYFIELALSYSKDGTLINSTFRSLFGSIIIAPKKIIQKNKER